MAHIGTRKLTISIDGVERNMDVSRAIVSAGERDSDFVSFAEADAGGAREYTLLLTMAQDAATGSLWREIWDNAGTEVDVIVRPYGNATATATQPHFEGTVVITEPDGELLGGEADASATAVFTVEVEWKFVAKPTTVTA